MLYDYYYKAESFNMNILTISTARSDLFNVAQTAIDTHEPVVITSKHGNVVLISEEDYKAIQETLYLQSIPNYVKEVKEGLAEPKDDLSTRDDLPW